MASPPEEVSKPKTASPPTPSQWEPSVNCVQCGGDLKDPHLLACLHCLCKECLPRAAREDGRLKCPAPDCGDCSTTWRQPDVVALPRCEERGRVCVPVQCTTVGRYVEGKKILRQVTGGRRMTCGYPQCNDSGSEATIFCSTCELFFCKTCEVGHKWMEGMTSKHDVRSIEVIRSRTGQGDVTRLCKVVPLCCPRHRGKVLEYQCEVCDLLMCQACTMAKDSNHCLTSLNTEVPLPPRHLQAVELGQKVASFNQKQCMVAQETVGGWATEVEGKKESALCDMREWFQAYHATLDYREQKLCDKIRAVSEARKESVADIIRSYCIKRDILSNRQAMLSFLSTEGSPLEVISYHRVLVAGPTHRRSEAAVSHVMQFMQKQEAALKAAIERFGCIEVGACPANCTLEPALDKDRRGSANDPIMFTLLTADQEKTPCSVGGEMVQSFLRPRPPLPGPSIKAVVNDNDSGRYKVTFDLTYTGACELSVLVNGAHICGSPFAVELGSVPDVRLLLKRGLNTLRACKGTLQFPEQPGSLTGVAVAPNGSIYVSDYENHKVHMFDAERNFIMSFGQQGSGKVQLQSPSGFAISTDGLLYVTHECGVDVITFDGNFVSRIGNGTLKMPRHVTIHNRHVVVADSGNHRVAVFSRDGKLIHTIGSQGTGPGQFSNPSGVAISPDGELYVSDCSNGRVQVLTLRGEYIREFGKGLLKGQHKLLFSGDRHVLVADQVNNRVAVFNQEGALVSSLPCANGPVGLAVDQKGDLLVACFSSKCVHIYNLMLLASQHRPIVVGSMV